MVQLNHTTLTDETESREKSKNSFYKEEQHNLTEYYQYYTIKSKC